MANFLVKGLKLGWKHREQIGNAAKQAAHATTRVKDEIRETRGKRSREPASPPDEEIALSPRPKRRRRKEPPEPEPANQCILPA